MQDADAAAAAIAAIAALTGLKSLDITSQDCIGSDERRFTSAQLQRFLKLRHLTRVCLFIEDLLDDPVKKHLQPLSQLSALVHLEDLDQVIAPFQGVPGLPSQLTKLTRLHTFCNNNKYLKPAVLQRCLQHLSCLTALQQLSVSGRKLSADHLSGIAKLSQLTSLVLDG